MALIMSDQTGITNSQNSMVLVNEVIVLNSRNSVDEAVKEIVIVIVIRSDEEGGNGDALPISKEVGEEDKLKMKDLGKEKNSFVIDVKSGNAGDCEQFERVCRICQLSSEVLFEKKIGTCMNEMDLIQLGCGCKEEMSIAHSHCAETWFKLKGNRVCEICGEAAKNITGIRDKTLMEEWNDIRFNHVPASEGSEGCWRGKPFCNFLMACLVLAIIVPSFLHLTWFS